MKITSTIIFTFCFVLGTLLLFSGTTNGIMGSGNESCPEHAVCLYSFINLRGVKLVWYKNNGTVRFPLELINHVGSYIANDDCCLLAEFSNDKYPIAAKTAKHNFLSYPASNRAGTITVKC